MRFLASIADAYVGLFAKVDAAELVLCLAVIAVLLWSIVRSASETRAVLRSYGAWFWCTTLGTILIAFLVGMFVVPTTFWR